MKRINKPWAVAATLAALLFISMIYTTKYANLVDEQRATISHLQMQANNCNLENYKEALRLADTIMDNNELWDRDGSDVMTDYLHLRSNMDTAFYQGFHENPLLDNLSADFYNE